MSRIIVLDQLTANSIAAGEVVERPASVVKELCENALDAGADMISIVIRNGGVRMIQVTDNGCGMDRSDAVSAFLPHATSKLRVITDLDHLSTMGFRGEALASISAVSKVTLKTRQATDAEGTLVVIEGGDILRHEACGTPVGTTIQVENLFYNTPARYKFLKKDTTEAGRIQEIVQRLVMARPDVSFRLINNDQQVLHSPGNNDLESAIYSIFGKKTMGDMLELKGLEQGQIRLSGYIGKPEFARRSRQWQLFYINDRVVKAAVLTKALEEGYRSLLMKGQFPTAVLKLELPSNLVDVNVHPQKTEVRFSNEGELFSTVMHAVKDTLQAVLGPRESEFSVGSTSFLGDELPERRIPQPLETVGDGDRSGGSGLGYGLGSGVGSVSGPDAAGDAVQAAVQPIQQGLDGGMRSEADPSALPTRPMNGHITGASVLSRLVGDPDREVTDGFLVSGDGLPFDYGSVEENKTPYDHSSDPYRLAGDPALSMVQGSGPASSGSNSYQGPGGCSGPSDDSPMDEVLRGRLVGVLFNTYIIIEGVDCFYMIDQHAAHEKINFERMIRTYRETELIRQPLLSPVTVDLTADEMEVAEDEREFIERLGFEYEAFGQNTIVIRSFPLSIDGAAPDLAFGSVVKQLSVMPASVLESMDSETAYDVIATMACKASVKAHDRLNEEEIRSLLLQMRESENPWQCPHGRPAIIGVTAYEIEKLFKRVIS